MNIGLIFPKIPVKPLNDLENTIDLNHSIKNFLSMLPTGPVASEHQYSLQVP